MTTNNPFQSDGARTGESGARRSLLATNTPCLAEPQLMALANGEPPDESAMSHLEVCSACRRKLERIRSQLSSLRDAETDIDDSSETLPAPLPPVRQSIREYRIIEELGPGGQARVYRAVHAGLASEVVLKVGHHPVPPAEQEGDRLVREARLLKNLRHPNLAQVHDLFFDDDHPVLVMDFIRGRTLRQVKSERTISAREAAALIAKVARALAPAHAAGVFHRDITPRNIIIDEAGQPRLIDFGLARCRHAWDEGLEAPGVRYGTTGFMAPEQEQGRNDDIDARTDIYALGAVLCDMLAPRPVGHLLTPPAAVGSAAGASAAPPESSPPPKSFAAPPDRLGEAGVPARLRRTIEKAMQPEPQRRFASAADLARDLERFAAGPRWRICAATGSLAAAAAAAAIVLHARPPVPAPAPPPAVAVPSANQDLLHLPDNRSLAACLPLDYQPPVFLSVDLPHGSKPVLAWVDPDGSVKTFSDLERVDAGSSPFDRYEYWRNGLRIGSADRPDRAGWKLVLVFALPRNSGPADIDKLAADVAAAIPKAQLPAGPDDHCAFRFGHSDSAAVVEEVREPGLRSVESIPLDPEEKAMKERVAQLQATLWQKGYHYFTGLAVPYMPRFN